jgi:hypothetical protein
LSVKRRSQTYALTRRLNGFFLAAIVGILIPVSTAPTAAVAASVTTTNPSKPNLFNPASHSRSIKHSPPLSPVTPSASAPDSSSGDMKCKIGSFPMLPARVALGPSTANHFVSNDGRLSIDLPSGAVSPAQVVADGGATSLLIRQILPASGSNAGGSGHYSFGTYLIQVVGAAGHLANHGLQTPVTLKLHYGTADSAQDIGHAYAVINGPVPSCVNLDPASVAVPGQAPSIPPSASVSSPSTQIGTSTAPTAQSGPSSAASAPLSATIGAPSAPATSVDPTDQTLTTTMTIDSASTSAGWSTNSAIATFGKPDPTEVDLSGGALTTSYNIDVPAGPKGFKPPLSLVYNSAGVNDQHNVQGAAPWVGEGWNMTMGSISWAEHNVNGAWQDNWELSDAFGTGASLIPPATSTAI